MSLRAYNAVEFVVGVQGRERLYFIVRCVGEGGADMFPPSASYNNNSVFYCANLCLQRRICIGFAWTISQFLSHFGTSVQIVHSFSVPTESAFGTVIACNWHWRTLIFASHWGARWSEQYASTTSWVGMPYRNQVIHAQLVLANLCHCPSRRLRSVLCCSELKYKTYKT